MSYEIIDAQYVLDHLGKLRIVDVRPALLYEEGHIPGAISIELMKAKESPEDTETYFVREFKEAGFAPEDKFIVYCQSGHLAQEACALLEDSGYTGQKCYVGSWLDWTSDPSRPIEH